MILKELGVEKNDQYRFIYSFIRELKNKNLQQKKKKVNRVLCYRPIIIEWGRRVSQPREIINRSVIDELLGTIKSIFFD